MIDLMNDIYTACCEVVGVDIAEKKRTRDTYVYGRFVFFHLTRKHCPKLSLSIIGGRVNVDHATVLHGIKKLNDTFYADEHLRYIYKKAEGMLNMLDEKYSDQESQRIEKEHRQKRISLIRGLVTEVRRLRNENRTLKSVVENKDVLDVVSSIPEHLIENFMETRVKPYLKMAKL